MVGRHVLRPYFLRTWPRLRPALARRPELQAAYRPVKVWQGGCGIRCTCNIHTYIYTHIYIYIHIHICIHTHTHTHIYIYVRVCICTLWGTFEWILCFFSTLALARSSCKTAAQQCMNIYIYIHRCICAFFHVLYIYVHMHFHSVHVYIHIYIYTLTGIHLYTITYICRYTGYVPKCIDRPR